MYKAQSTIYRDKSCAMMILARPRRLDRVSLVGVDDDDDEDVEVDEELSSPSRSRTRMRLNTKSTIFVSLGVRYGVGGPASIGTEICCDSLA